MARPESYSNQILKNFVSNLSWWGRFKINLEIRKELFIHKIFPTFYLWKDWFWIRIYGFKPIYVIKSFFGETTFIFKTEKEAIRAFALLERKKKKVIGWWYSIKHFRQTLYEQDRSWNEFEIWHQNLKN